MTPDDRYREFYDHCDGFKNKAMIRHHFLWHIRDAVVRDRADTGKKLKLYEDALNTISKNACCDNCGSANIAKLAMEIKEAGQ